jgi:lysophospholipase L1-like esterase
MKKKVIALLIISLSTYFIYIQHIRPWYLEYSIINSEKYRNKKQKIENTIIKNKSKILLGDSILESLISDQENIYNFSISGETINSLTKRLKYLNINDSATIYCMIGINDLLFNNSLKNIYDNYRKLFKVLKNYKIKVYILELLPISADGFFFDLNDINLKVTQINKFIYKNSFNNYSVISTYKYFCNYKSELIQDFTYDGIHLNEKGKEKLILLLD